MKKYQYLLLPFLWLLTSYSHAEKVQIKHDDITLNANLELAEGKKLEDGVILMTHGTMAHNGHSIISEFQSLFAENGVNSLAITLGLNVDNRSGMYDCTKTHTHKHTDALTEIGLWKDWLKERGATDITLLGHSRGGNQTAWYVEENDDPAIKRIALIAPATWHEDDEAKGYEEKYGTPLKPILEKAQALVKDNKGDQILEKTDFIYCENANVSAASFTSYYTPNEKFDSPTLISRINEKVLVVAGSDDNISKGLIKHVEPLTSKDNVTLFVVDGAGHMFRDLFGEEVVEQVVEFVGN